MALEKLWEHTGAEKLEVWISRECMLEVGVREFRIAEPLVFSN